MESGGFCRNDFASIPVDLGFDEALSFLCFLKMFYVNGSLSKESLSTAFSAFGIDKRTGKKYVAKLLRTGLIGESKVTIHLRKWDTIYTVMGWRDAYSFKVRLDQVIDRKVFEVLLFTAKVDRTLKRGRRSLRVRDRGCTNQSKRLSTAYLSKSFGISAGKVSRLKAASKKLGLMKVEPRYEEIMKGDISQVQFFRKAWDEPVFYLNGAYMKREIDYLEPKNLTYKIRPRVMKVKGKEVNNGLTTELKKPLNNLLGSLVA